MAFLSTSSILAAVKVAVESVKLENGESAFEKVEVFHKNDLRAALAALLVTESRVAVIVPVKHSYANATDGPKLISRKSIEIAIIAADRQIRRSEAALGGENNPGAVSLAESLMSELCGTRLALNGCLVTPAEGEPVQIESEDGERMPGREAWVQGFEIEAGGVTVVRGRSANA